MPNGTRSPQIFRREREHDAFRLGLEKSGDAKGARENYKKALAMAPEDQKKRITDIIGKLK